MQTDRNQSDWNFGSVSVLVVGSLIAILAAVAYPYGWFSPYTPVAVAAFGAVMVGLVGRLRHLPISLLIYRMGCWFGLGGWATTTAFLGLSPTIFLVLAAVLLILGLVLPMVTPDPDEIPDVVLGGGQLTTGVALDWKRRIDKICRIDAPGVTITHQEDWENGTGFTLTIEGPPGSGFTYRTLVDELDSLGAAAKLKPGCVLHAFEGEEHQGQARLNVPITYDLANVRPYPVDYSPLTVNEMIPIGFFPDGTLVEIEVREGSMLIIGRKGGGKTTLLHDITASFARCTDALIWHIDMNAGGMSAPWLLPWLEEKCDLPVIDWFAHEEAEALLMSHVALAIVKERKKVYQRRMARANTSLLPLDAEVPEIFLMIDEAAEVLGEDSQCLQLGQNIREIMRMGRAVGVNVLISALRPVGDHLPVQVRKNCTTRIAMRVEEKDEFDYTFEKSKGLDPEMIKHKGEGFIFRGEIDTRPAKWRSFSMDPNQIVQISIATSHLHPELDQKSLPSKWVETYGNRWDRCASYLNDMIRDDDFEQEPEDDPTPAARPMPSGPDKTQAGSVAVKQSAATPGDFEAEVLAGLENIPVAEPVRPQRGRTRTLSEGAQLVVTIVTEPMMMAQIRGEVDAAGKNVTRQTVADWAKEAVDAGHIETTTKKGQYQPVGWTAPPEDDRV